MSVPVKLAGFTAALAVLFGGAALAGDAIDPQTDKAPAHAEGARGEGAGHGAGEAAGGHGGGERVAHPVRGLGVADGDLRLVVDRAELPRGRATTVRFRVVDERGATVRDFDVEHEKRMHLILARRDLTGFQHLHPRQTADGAWETQVTLEDAGSYRLFADFAHEDEPHTLAGDLRVDGAADLRDLPAPRTTATSTGGYDVELDAASASAGREADLRFTITKDGAPVDVEPYLGAGGHLVALREGDLAFLHVHPTEDVSFAATFPTTGRYRLFLQFLIDGEVQTVAFTQEVR